MEKVSPKLRKKTKKEKDPSSISPIPNFSEESPDLQSDNEMSVDYSESPLITFEDPDAGDANSADDVEEAAVKPKGVILADRITVLPCDKSRKEHVTQALFRDSPHVAKIQTSAQRRISATPTSDRGGSDALSVRSPGIVVIQPPPSGKLDVSNYKMFFEQWRLRGEVGLDATLFQSHIPLAIRIWLEGKLTKLLGDPTFPLPPKLKASVNTREPNFTMSLGVDDIAFLVELVVQYEVIKASVNPVSAFQAISRLTINDHTDLSFYQFLADLEPIFRAHLGYDDLGNFAPEVKPADVYINIHKALVTLGQNDTFIFRTAAHAFHEAERKFQRDQLALNRVPWHEFRAAAVLEYEECCINVSRDMFHEMRTDLVLGKIPTPNPPITTPAVSSATATATAPPAASTVIALHGAFCDKESSYSSSSHRVYAVHRDRDRQRDRDSNRDRKHKRRRRSRRSSRDSRHNRVDRRRSHYEPPHQPAKQALPAGY